jgi:cytochrome P450
MKPVRGVRAALWLAKFLRDPVASMQEAYRRHGPLCAVGNAPPRRRETLHVLALGPDFNRAVLGDPDLFHNSTPNPPGSALGRIRCGLTAMNGAKHRQQRQLVQPPFTRKAVDGYVADMVALIGPLIERWPSGGVVEIGGEMRRLALRSSARLLFGREDRDRVDAMGELIQEYLRRSCSTGVHAFPYKWPGTPYRGLRRHAERIERELLVIFRDRRDRDRDRAGTGTGGNPDLLDILVRARDHGYGAMTDTDLLGQALILLAASYENVGSTLTWTLFLVAQHPGIAVALCDELGSDPPTAERLNRLPLLDAVVKESLRVLPPVPFMVRVAGRPTDLGGVPLRPGDRVACSPYMTHHLPHLYPEPERFAAGRRRSPRHQDDGDRIANPNAAVTDANEGSISMLAMMPAEAIASSSFRSRTGSSVAVARQDPGVGHEPEHGHRAEPDVKRSAKVARVKSGSPTSTDHRR